MPTGVRLEVDDENNACVSWDPAAALPSPLAAKSAVVEYVVRTTAKLVGEKGTARPLVTSFLEAFFF